MRESVTVGELMDTLRAMPSDARVLCLWDGHCRTAPFHVWLSQGGFVVLADANEPCYSDEERPIGAPTEKDEPYWDTPDASVKTVWRVR